ncbi:MAG: N-acetyltransferase family protein [Actinobacteria bacterium]|nr:N-acetyltransferase family protein [Actinomycetota bacterium]MCL6105014.1 N-acetyltransferase family protein [Actinomycetota bacterium]
MKNKGEEINIRLAEISDAQAILKIYNEAVTGSTVTFDIVPRSLEEQITWLEEHRGVYPAIVAAQNSNQPGSHPDNSQNNIVGFGALSPYRQRPAYATSVEDSVYVTSNCQATGIGKMILNELITLGRQHGFHTIVAHMESGNNASIRLHQSCGFKVVGTEKEVGRKFTKWLDITIMQLML